MYYYIDSYIFFAAKLLIPNLINTNPRLKLKFDDIWAGTYATFAKVAMKNDLYVFGLNNYNQLGNIIEVFFLICI